MLHERPSLTPMDCHPGQTRIRIPAWDPYQA